MAMPVHLPLEKWERKYLFFDQVVSMRQTGMAQVAPMPFPAQSCLSAFGKVGKKYLFFDQAEPMRQTCLGQKHLGATQAWPMHGPPAC